jgi:hypothetical protein
VGEIFLFETGLTASGEALSKMHGNELALGRIEDAVDYLTLLPSLIGLSAGDWNVYSTRAQFALGRALTAIEKIEPWKNDATDSCAFPEREWAEVSAKVRREGMVVAALASALCSNSMLPADRSQTQSIITTEVTHLIAEFVRVQAIFQNSA